MRRLFSLAIIRSIFSGLTLIPLLVSCGKTIENAQDFVPNDPPVIESCTVTDNSTGKEVDASNIILGMTLKCSVRARDPEGKTLEYVFTSDYLSLSSQTNTADGCDGVFVVTKVIANTPVTLSVSVRDQKDASATKLVPVGTGKEGPLLTLGSPDKARINNTGSTAFTFSCTSDGWYQALESGDDVSKDPSSHMTASVKYFVGSEKTVAVTGPSYAGASDVHVSSGDGEKKIWIVFKDNNNYYAASSVSVMLDNAAPTVMSTIPANGATNVSTALKTVSVTFSEGMSTASLLSALSIPGLGVTYKSYDESSSTAVYAITGMAAGTIYTATVSGATDIAGNIVTSSPFGFSTAPLTITYSLNMSSGTLEGTLPDGSSCLKGQTYTTAEFPGKGSATRASVINAGGTSYYFSGWSETSSGGTTISSGTTRTMGASNVVLYAQWTAYAVGDSGPAGGRIFNVNPDYSSGCRYYEVEYCDASTDVSHYMIYSAAVNYCTNHAQNGYSDWSLPTLSELDNMFYTRGTSNAGLANSYQFWTSDISSAGCHWTIRFDLGGQHASYSDSTTNIPRAIRRF